MAATEDADVPADSEPRRKSRRRFRDRFSETDGSYYSELAERVEKILRLAEAEAEEIREAGRKEAASIIEAAERDAARIRAAAMAVRDEAQKQP